MLLSTAWRWENVQRLRASPALECLISYELMKILLIALEYHLNRDAYYFKYCILEHLLNLLVLLLKPVFCLYRRVIPTGLRTIGEASGNCSTAENRHLLLGSRQARTIKGLTPPTSFIVVLLRFRFSGIWGWDKASVDANAFSISLVPISYNY